MNYRLSFTTAFSFGMLALACGAAPSVAQDLDAPRPIAGPHTR